MDNIIEKCRCTGCHACFNACPANAIEMIDDEKTGFKYPVINQEKCINCGKCKKVCPVIESCEAEEIHYAFACYNKNMDERLNSSSGGIFILLAKEVINRGGVVFGACFDNEFNVVHSYAESINDLSKFMTSKYVQSSIGETYKEAKSFLDDGRLVYFSGTPCQIEGLLSYLGKNYDNLITQDIICHGVPSPKAWEAYKKYRLFADGKKPMRINFRQKDDGWNLYALSLQYNDSAYKTNHHDDLFMQAFLRNACLRDSCYNCSFKKYYRKSDITLADFWGIKNVCPEMDPDNKGTSLVLVSSNKGKDLFNSVSNEMVCKDVDLDEAIKYNSSYTKSVSKPAKRDEFFENLDKVSFDKLVKKYTVQVPLWKKILGKGKRIIKRIIKG